MQGREKKHIIIAAVIISIFLFMSGVFSGLYASKVIRKETKESIENIEMQTKEGIFELNNYVQIMEKSFQDIQLEQSFMESLDKKEACRFNSISIDEHLDRLSEYWDLLPFRIEQYERDNELSDEYLELKEQYTLLSVKTWIIAKKHRMCRDDFYEGLYFYSKDCENCVMQGEELDKFKEEIERSEKEFVLFTVDADSDKKIIKHLKEYYGIDSTPAIILNDKVYQGRLINHEELLEGLGIE